MIDTTIFFELVRRHQIYSTPALVIDDHEPVFGLLTETEVAQRVMQVAGPRPFGAEDVT